MEKSTPLCNGKGSNADKVQDSETSLLISKNADKNYIEDTKTTPKSYLDVVFELLATTAGTSSSNSLPESVRLLMTHKYRGSIVVPSISKSVKPNEEQKGMTSGF